MQKVYFDCYKRVVNSTSTIFLFHHAGGTADFYATWIDYLPEECDIYVLSLPGRGKKTMWTEVTNFNDLIQALTLEMTPFLKKPVIFFGHSMGGLIAYSLSINLLKTTNDVSLHLNISSYPAPHIPNSNIFDDNVSDDELITRLIERNGTSDDFLSNRRFLRLIVPMLRADYKLLNSFTHQLSPALNCPITVISGTTDNVTESEMQEWRNYTTSSFSSLKLEGDHFYLKQTSNMKKITGYLSDQLEYASM